MTDHTYQKKPVKVQAFQMTPERRKDNSEWPEWLHEAWNKEFGEPGALSPADHPNSDGTDHLVISTLEGVMTIGWGDWIIQGVSGELYPCKDPIFQQTYIKSHTPQAGKPPEKTEAEKYFDERDQIEQSLGLEDSDIDSDD